MIFFIYQFLLSIIIFLSPFIIIFRIFKSKEDKFRFKEKFCFISKQRGSGKLIWFHGSSVGEILSAVPIIKKYDNDKSINKILVTSSTLSSSKILEKIKFKKTIHQFYPIDHILFSKKFLEHWKPDIAIFLESEIWPSMFRSIKKRGVRLILLNARITKKSFNRWSIIKKFSCSIFSLIDKAYSQNSETNYFLKKLKVKKITSTGNLKFIGHDSFVANSADKKLFSQFRKYKTFVAASTHNTEELFAAKTHILLKKKLKNIITIIIPRHVDRVDQIISQINELGLNVISRRSNKKKLDNIDVYLVDTFGESQKFYKFATTVFLGGSIIKRGGQNPLEPARFGAKILHGPNIDNFRDVYKYLNDLKISSTIYTPKQCANSINFKKNMKKVIKMKYLGTTILKKTLNELDKSIHNEI
ncbi:3-deoxy-D-manno-octulosonic acid transferase [Candidatus Pelagibacter sp.]|nr:3-deoxy-D-manno-octulosonic acid transferase [Candidatus Pelagibacter sp.]